MSASKIQFAVEVTHKLDEHHVQTRRLDGATTGIVCTAIRLQPEVGDSGFATFSRISREWAFTSH